VDSSFVGYGTTSWAKWFWAFRPAALKLINQPFNSTVEDEGAK
jgi:hypothetical protein